MAHMLGFPGFKGCNLVIQFFTMKYFIVPLRQQVSVVLPAHFVSSPPFTGTLVCVRMYVLWWWEGGIIG